MPVCDQEHSGVSVAVAGTLAGGLLEPFDLFFDQIFPRPELSIWWSARNCPVYDSREGSFAGGFCRVIQSWRCPHCLELMMFAIRQLEPIAAALKKKYYELY
jgi:hypothetical protein